MGNKSVPNEASWPNGGRQDWPDRLRCNPNRLDCQDTHRMSISIQHCIDLHHMAMRIYLLHGLPRYQAYFRLTNMTLLFIGTVTPTNLDSNLCESLCSIFAFWVKSGLIRFNSIISWQPLHTPNDNVSLRA